MLNLLWVDDDQIDVMTARRALAKANVEHHFFEAHDGVTALQMLRSGQVPREKLVVMLDLNMPRMGGLEFLNAIRADAELATLKVVVLTTSDRPPDLNAAHGFNVAGYFVKPLEYASFVEFLKTFEKYWTASR